MARKLFVAIAYITGCALIKSTADGTDAEMMIAGCVLAAWADLGWCCEESAHDK